MTTTERAGRVAGLVDVTLKEGEEFITSANMSPLEAIEWVMAHFGYDGTITVGRSQRQSQ